MPSNKNASYRYRLIDALLKGGRKWDFKEFLMTVGDRLCEEFEAQSLISERTLVSDIQVMRKNPPQGFAAPIIRKKKKIFYKNPQFSIYDLPLIDDDKKNIQNALSMLRQFKGLPHSGELLSVIHKINAYTPLNIQDNPSEVIFVEQNKDLKGLKWISPLFSNINRHKKVNLTYRSFKRDTSKTLVFRPYLLKEFNNRWFVLGYNEAENKLWLFALDRIVDIESRGEYFIPDSNFNGREYFDHIIGVTLPADRKLEKLLLRFTPARAPYVVTKPLHPSQEVLHECKTNGTDIRITVIPNQELISQLLSFGSDVEVLAPAELRNEMQAIYIAAMKQYE